MLQLGDKIDEFALRMKNKKDERHHGKKYVCILLTFCVFYRYNPAEELKGRLDLHLITISTV